MNPSCVCVCVLFPKTYIEKIYVLSGHKAQIKLCVCSFGGHMLVINEFEL